MMKELIKQIKEKIKMSEKRTLEKFNEEEEDLTARFLENLGRDFEEIKSEENKIKTKIFKRKNSKEEKLFGADFLVILNIFDGESETHKYFLSQSKKCVDKSKLIFDNKLKKQCEKMIYITSDSFISVYTKEGIFVKSALNKNLEYKDIISFFEDFINCFIGDVHYRNYRIFCRHFKYHNIFPFNIEDLSKEMHLLHITIEKIKK